MIVSRLGGRRAAIRPEENSAVFAGPHTARRERPGSDRRGRPARTVLEVRRSYGGMTMRALLGAVFVPGAPGTGTVFEVRHGTPWELGEPGTCRSELGTPLLAGLPSDFAPAVLDALAGTGADPPLPPGVLRVDRSGFDALASSEAAFTLTAAVLRQATDALARGGDAIAVTRAALNRW